MPCLHLGFTFSVVSAPGPGGQVSAGLAGLFTQATSTSCSAARHQRNVTARPDCPDLPAPAGRAVGPQGAPGGLPDRPVGHLSLSERRAQVPAAPDCQPLPGNLAVNIAGRVRLALCPRSHRFLCRIGVPSSLGSLSSWARLASSIPWAQRWLLRTAAPRPCDATSPAGRDFVQVRPG